VAVPLGFVVGLLATPFLGDPSSSGLIVIGFVVGLAIGTILSWFWLRWGLILPATAVGRPMTMGDSWNATKQHSGAIFTAVLILIALNLVVSLVVGFVLGDNIVTAILGLVINWISLMIGISILTTLYGLVVEGRVLD
jgi:hydrogenase-4 membrane subunit HyfE